jgi:hypothetical protein
MPPIRTMLLLLLSVEFDIDMTVAIVVDGLSMLIEAFTCSLVVCGHVDVVGGDDVAAVVSVNNVVVVVVDGEFVVVVVVVVV